MKIGSVPATIMVVALVVVAALLYFLTREDPQESDVVAPPVGTETVEPPPADDDTADSVQPQEPVGEDETVDPADRPSEGELDADKGAEPEVADQPEGTAPSGDPVPTVDPETEDPAARPSEDGLDADEGVEPDVAGEPEGTAPSGDPVPTVEPETEDPVARPSESGLDADEGAEPDEVGEPEVTVPPDDSVPTGEAETEDPADRPSEGKSDAGGDVEQDRAEESVGMAGTGDADSIEPGLPEDTATATPDPTPAIDQPADGVAELDKPASDPAVSAQPPDTPEMADRLASGDETTPVSEVDPCDGIRAMTDDADAVADGAVPCPDETGAPPEEADTAPESRAPADGQVSDEVSGEGTGDEVPEDEGETEEPTVESDAPAGEADIVPESRAPADGQVSDEVSGEGTGDEAPEDAGETEEPAVESDAPAGEADIVPESRAPADGQVSDEVSGEGTGDEVPEDAGVAEGPADDSDEPSEEADTAPVGQAPTEGPVMDGASGESTVDETPPASEVDPCDGIRAMTDDTDAVADGAVPCPGETGAPAGEMDAAPESPAPTDGQITDDVSGEGTGDEVPEDAGEAEEPAVESDAPAGEADIVPESRAPADERVADEVTGKGTGEEVSEDAEKAPESPDESGAAAEKADTALVGQAPTEGPVMDGASGESTVDETPPASEVDPCDGIRAMTDDADAVADGAVPCPDETGAPADEADTTPESRAPTDDQVSDGASGEGTAEEVPEDAVEAPEPAGETGAPADEVDTAPESRAPTGGQVVDGASGEGTAEEVPEDPAEATEPADGTGAPADEADTTPESRAPTDGQVVDGAPGEGTAEEVPEDSDRAEEPPGETDESTAESLPEVQETPPDAEELEPVEALSKMEDQACPDDPLDEVATDGRRPCPEEPLEVDQPDVDSEPGRQAPTETDSGSEKAADVPRESVEDGEEDEPGPPETSAEADEEPTPDGTADAVTPGGTADVGTPVMDEADSGDEKAEVIDGTLKEPADDASEPSPDTAQTAQPASEQPGESVEVTEIDDGTARDVGSASGLPEEKIESVPESPEVVDVEAAEEAPAPSVAEITEDTAIEGESPVADPTDEDLIPPSFDLVRVDRFGTTVLAGRAPVDSLVEALVDGEVAGSQSAGRIGQFAMIFSVDTQRDTLAIGLRATLPDGRSVDSDSSVFVVVPHGRMVPVNPVVEEGTGIESIAPVELPTTKLADLEGLQPSVLLATNEGVRLIQPSDPGDEGKLLVEIVSYDEQGEVFIAGSTRTDRGRISIFLNGDLVKSIEISPGGSWWTDLKGVEPGRYRLRVEEIDQSGTVVASVEMPFQKESPEHAREMLTSASRSSEVETTGADQGPIISLLAVQRGFTLWGISRKQYGLGRLYVNIFEANRDQIDNPHLIYPGQIFILPHESQLVDPLW